MGKRVVTLDSKDVGGDTPLHVMIWRGDRDAVRAFIEAGAKIDAIGDMGQTPLHVAVMREDEFSAELLLRAGADPEVRSEFGDTPRELARQKGGRMKELLT
jgi:ankyrin repeat protein